MEDFQLLEDKLLGEGSYGKVYKCYWHGTLAAAKLFNVGKATETREILQEIGMIKRLRHDYIIQYFGEAHHNGKLCLITSYAEKGSLYNVLHNHNLPKDQKPRIITGLIKGMLFLQRSNVVHRDFKSGNVLLDTNYVPKICDFGLARLKLNSATMTKASTTVGTTRWMAPELFLRGSRYSFSSDVYALGLVIWEILTEKIPYAETISEVVIRGFIIDGELEHIPESTPEHYKNMIESCWHYHPKDRITVAQLNEVNDRASPSVDSDYEDDGDIIYTDDIPASLNFSDTDSGYTSSQQKSTRSFQLPTDYTWVIDQHIQDSRSISYTKAHLASLLDEYSEDFVLWIKTTAQQEHRASTIMLGEMYYHGCGVPQDFHTAFVQFTKPVKQKEEIEDLINGSTESVETGNVRVQPYLGLMYMHGEGVQQSSEDALRWFMKAAEHGNLYSMNEVGCMYRDGHGVPQSDKNAAEWFGRAAAQGDADAQFNLAWMYRNGRAVRETNEKSVAPNKKPVDQDAVESENRPVDQDLVNAQFKLAVKYEGGRGVPQSDHKAVEWFSKAAGHGLAIAQNWMGWMYQHGRGVQQDYSKAAEWFAKAAEQDDPDAQYKLGLLYENGQGVQKNIHKAVDLYKKAAALDFPAAQNKLGDMYADGQGVPQSDEKAIEMYTKAARQRN